MSLVSCFHVASMFCIQMFKKLAEFDSSTFHILLLNHLFLCSLVLFIIRDIPFKLKSLFIMGYMQWGNLVTIGPVHDTCEAISWNYKSATNGASTEICDSSLCFGSWYGQFIKTIVWRYDLILIQISSTSLFDFMFLITNWFGTSWGFWDKTKHY